MLRAFFDRRPAYRTLVGGEEVYICPKTNATVNGSDRAYGRSYAMNSGGRENVGGLRPRGIAGYNTVPTWRLPQIPDPTGTILLTEIVQEWNNTNRGVQLGNIQGTVNHPYGQTRNYTVVPYHNNHFNYLFCDGHVQLLMPLNTVGTGGPGTFEQDAKGMWTRAKGD